MLSNGSPKGTKNTHNSNCTSKCDQCYRDVDLRDLNNDSIYSIKSYVCNECFANGKSNHHNWIEINKKINEKGI